MNHGLTPHDGVRSAARVQTGEESGRVTSLLLEEVKLLFSTTDAYLLWKNCLSLLKARVQWLASALHSLRGAIWREHVFTRIFQ